MRQTVLIAVVATLLIPSASHPAKAFSPIGIAIGAGMLSGAMHDDSYRWQKSQQSEQYQSATESDSTKKNVKARNHKSKRDESKYMTQKSQKSSPPKAKSRESVASGPRPTPDKFTE